ncbi:hypothetical protein [Streptomyces barringtoniae]|uniref:hypothetical protein n=1 Tax=Streptomyces barringtoniae TaxID=2892029 RepID=UPI001E37C442|nr:hypothetical protein [Streptomyces barringtoniae]MCC5476876.1 hypothetical protein [Streptomyces barringtoniae]
MASENTQQPIDLTTPENVDKGQQVYARIESGECTDVKAELDAAYGITSEQD